ncbi:putative metal-dependent hydrolase of the TIM-barrel fold protein [Variovorax sp. PBS-H4]|uniref:amidohydrolase family protein n=1 Tax=Variovorax sp. PBS-H4 TaxID=434008 RepID=UPI001318A241|nr:amidohydrolase family protein [Variovorax sp. PBS-H4]VTU21926.1 putative metal-dependent hydrolase of the TIM-barrel fold protein [Variovorax sp. PBS-H4]
MHTRLQVPRPVPFSDGTAPPRTAMPAGACDCHVHVYDARFPTTPDARLLPPDASVDDYRLLQQRIGTVRAVLVAPSTYGIDNRCMLAGLAALGDAARGVAVLDETVSDEALQALHALGVRGIRFNLSLGAHPPAGSLRPMAERIAPLGWHLQLLAAPDTLLSLAPVLRDLPVALVFDHLGRIAPADAGRHAAHALVLDLLREGRAWIKLSGGYIVSATHRTDDAALDVLARSYLQAAPHRVVWGSDWPHATASAGRHPMPDDAAQVDALARWCSDEDTLCRVLVDNPAALYGFTPASPLSLS